MAYIAINGYELPPCKRGVKVIVTTIVNSGRDANGAVVGQRVGRDQYKIDGLEWAWLTAEQWESILKAVSNFFFHVTFIDPVTNSKRRSKCTAETVQENHTGSIRTEILRITEIAK